MRFGKLFFTSAVIGTVLLAAGLAAAATEHVLHSFNFTDGYDPNSPVVFDSSGNLYGTTFYGGGHDYEGDGVVFEVSPSSGGKWKTTIIHRFHGPDGSNPSGVLLVDASGNLYGTTAGGGENASGTVFELTPSADGKWKETVLYSFGGTDDGAVPYAGLVLGKHGILYGTTYSGGTSSDNCAWPGGCGTVFELTPRANGKWMETVLYRFKGPDGANPEEGVVLNGSGGLYGITSEGGAYNKCQYGCGVVFELTAVPGDQWHETVLYKFSNDSDGGFPNDLISDSAGNLYGVTFEGGDFNCYPVGCGVVFKLAQNGKGEWKEAVVWTFTNLGQGEDPTQLIWRSSGKLYGTSAFGDGYGNVFELTQAKDGKWNERVLLGFNGTSGGWGPTGVVFGPNRDLYGTTSAGGDYQKCEPPYGCGLVFEIGLAD